MSAMEMFLYEDNVSLFLRILSRYVNAEKKNIVKILSIRNSSRDLLKLPLEPFVVSQGELMTNEFGIAYLISTIAGRKADLFGIWEGDRERSLKFLEDYKKEFSNIPKFVENFNNLLQCLTFFNGMHITIVDIYAYSQIIRFMGDLPEQEKNKFTNVLRWVNHLQNLENLREIVSELRLNLAIPFEPLVLLKEEVKQVGKKQAAKEAAAEKAEFNRIQKELRMAKEKEGNCQSEKNTNNPTTETKVETKKEEKKETKKEEKKETKKEENGIKFKLILFIILIFKPKSHKKPQQKKK